jgi:hypothetical protein
VPKPGIPFLPVHWKPNDFQGVHKAFDDLFVKVGWK